MENSTTSHSPVDIGDLRAPSDSESGEGPEVQTGPSRPSGAILEPDTPTGRGPRRRTPRRASTLSSSAKVSLAWVVRDAVDMYLAEKWPLLFKNLW